MDISVVIPLFNEEESLPELVAWIKKVMDEHHFSYEIIMVDDGSRDNTWAVVQQLSAENPVISGISFQRNYGKAAALHIGFSKAKGDVVITMDADLQDSPDEIPELYRMITKDGYDLVSGWKKVRHDPVLSKNLPSKFYNWTVRRMTKIKLHDMNCGLKAYKKQVIKSIEVYGDMHRFIPVLAKWAGFKKIGEKVVKHQSGNTELQNLVLNVLFVVRSICFRLCSSRNSGNALCTCLVFLVLLCSLSVFLPHYGLGWQRFMPSNKASGWHWSPITLIFTSPSRR
jgi:glycosyltransferase involved in cell wall biosynthesis